MHVVTSILLVLACSEDESGTAFPAADLVRFPGASVIAGENDPLVAAERYQGADDDGYDWALASAGGTLYLGVPQAGEVRQFLGGGLVGGGAVVVAGEPGERFGASVDARGDVVVVGVPEHDGGPELDGAGATAFVGGVQVVGAAAQVGFGEVVAACGDIDEDGAADWAASAPFEAELGGAVYSGSVGQVDATVATLLRLEGLAGEAFGRSLACKLDLVDGVAPEVVVGVPFSPGGAGADAAGRVEVWSQLALAEGVPARLLYGQDLVGAEDERFGTALAVCNLDGDEWNDLVVGAPGAGDGAGAVYGFRGRVLRGSMLFGDVFTPSFVLTGPVVGAHFGDALDCGDLTGDGVDELFVGAPGEDAVDGTRETGALYAFEGPSTTWGGAASTEIAYASFRSDRAFLRAGDRFLVDDLDGDTLADVMMVIRQRTRGE